MLLQDTPVRLHTNTELLIAVDLRTLMDQIDFKNCDCLRASFGVGPLKNYCARIIQTPCSSYQAQADFMFMDKVSSLAIHFFYSTVLQLD